MAGLDLAHEAEGGDPPLPPPFLKLESIEMIDLTIIIINNSNDVNQEV